MPYQFEEITKDIPPDLLDKIKRGEALSDEEIYSVKQALDCGKSESMAVFRSSKQSK